MTEFSCLSAFELASAAEGTLSGAALQHALACRACRRRVDLLRRIARVGAHNIAEIADEAESLVATLLVMPRNTWWRTVREGPYQNPHVVRRLLALADHFGLRERKLAIALVTAATRIVDTLPDNTLDIGDLRFQSWKLAAAMFYEAARYKDAETALARAEAAARAASDPPLAEAMTFFYRALIFVEPDVWRPEEAESLLDRVEPLFRGDAVWQQAVQTARAFLAYRSGDFRAARTMFEEVLAATPVHARENWLNALSNVLFAAVDLGDVSEAVERQIRLLVDENVSLGRTVQVARACWLMGKVQRIRGDHEESVDQLRRARNDISDSDAAIRVGLDILETLLLAGRHDEALPFARELAAEAVALDQREPTRRRSLTASVLEYAREAARRGTLTADLVSELSRYLDRINRQRPTAFIPPMPLADM